MADPGTAPDPRNHDDALPELDAYDFALPESAIAQAPLAERDASRLLVVDRSAAQDAEPAHRHVRDLPSLLAPGDLLVVNRTRVVAAKLRGHKSSGGRAEALVLGGVEGHAGRYRALVKQGGKLRTGLVFDFVDPAGARHAEARVAALLEGGEVESHFADGVSPYALGEPPLPPYIRRRTAADATDPGARATAVASDAAPGGDREAQLEEDRARYQTVFADEPGAVAAPTAGLHLSEDTLARLEASGVRIASVVLHVGLGTFRPLRAHDLASGRLHREAFALPAATADAIAATRARGDRVVAVGTTTTRVLESCARDDRTVDARSGETDLFLRPGDPFRVVDGLLTNFHLPRSSLLMLVAAFAGRERVLAAYAGALRAGYRFYSYGDAMLVL